MKAELRYGTQGEFRGDITRDTFFPAKHLRQVITQQGRPCLDADFNEQTAIVLHYLQTLAMDLIGWHGGPQDSGFEISSTDTQPWDFAVTAGRYYVNGILCENDDVLTYAAQSDCPLATDSNNHGSRNLLSGGKHHLIYLDVWERHLTYVDDGRIRESALGDADTATRSRVVVQVKAVPVENSAPLIKALVQATYTQFLNRLVGLGVAVKPASGKLRARTRDAGGDASNPCIAAPSAHYRGAENRLYRVEIHQGGSAGKATFKWSRDNSSLIFPITRLTGSTASLETLGRDARTGLRSLDCVEIVDDDYMLQGRAEPLRRVSSVNWDTRQVTLTGSAASTVGQTLSKHPLLRRWDHRAADKAHDGALVVVEADSEQDENWIELEDGVLIQFPKPASGKPSHYHTGDYWLIPARSATGGVEWPQETRSDGTTVAAALPPHGIRHHYAPLAVVLVEDDGKIPTGEIKDCRRRFKLPLAP